MTLYLANPTTEEVRRAMTGELRGKLGAITTPDQRNAIPDGVPWVADNGLGPGRSSFKGDDADVRDKGRRLTAGKGARTDEQWFAWLSSRPWDASLCLFAVAPDVVGDAAATLERSAPWLPRIRSLGYPAALVAQDGLEDLPVPWDSFDVLFVGGSTEWKLGQVGNVSRLVADARARGKRIHVGRVNSLRRLRYAVGLAGDEVTADGTFLAFAPSTNLARLRVWLERIEGDPLLPLPIG